MALPKTYAWLAQEDGPRHLLKAIELYNIAETVGSNHNPVIMGWAKELAIKDYISDEIPWCGLFIAIVMHRASTSESPRPVVTGPLWALNWGNFGVKVTDGAKLGDVLTFKRPSGGHVGLYVGEDATRYFVLGGNQGNKVCIIPIAKSRVQAIRRPAYNQQPANVRKILLIDGTPSSENEA